MTTHEYLIRRGREYGRIPRLSVGEERELVTLWQDKRDARARRKLVEANMRHVEAIARRFTGRNATHEDLVAEGCIGLLVAIDKFDADKGVRLVTYAGYWIRAYIMRALNREWKRGKTGLGRVRWTAFYRARRTREAHVTRYGAEGAKLEGIASELGMSPEAVRELLECPDIFDLSLDYQAAVGDQRPSLHERLASERPGPEAATSRRETLDRMHDAVEQVFEGLSERERLVARARLMEAEPVTLRELGLRLGVSRERVRQIEVRVRQKLDRALREDGWSSASLM
jgi:RNA polymerase sigma-32 factor